MTARMLAETRRANWGVDRWDRCVKAIKQLGSDELDVRLGGTCGLERIAETSERDQPAIVEVLGDYVHQHTNPTQDPLQDPTAARDKPPLQPAVDTQPTVTVLGRLPSCPGSSGRS